MNSLNTLPRAVLLPAFLLPFSRRDCYLDGLISVFSSHALKVLADLEVGQFDPQCCRQNCQPDSLLGAI